MLSIGGLVLLFCGAFIAPQGEIHESLLVGFTEVAAMVKTRAKDLMKVTEDQEAFAAQLNTASGKRTMRAYLWKVCGAEYDAQHNG